MEVREESWPFYLALGNSLCGAFLVSELLLGRRALRPLHAGLVIGTCVVNLLHFLSDEWSRYFHSPSFYKPVQFVVAACVYLVCLFFDVRRYRRSYTAFVFAKDIAYGVRLVLPLAPCFVVVMSTVLFVLTSVIDKVVHQHLRWIVLQGQFFGPLVALYFLVKKQWIRTEPTLLPSL
eukprot:GEMP01088839.1.p1 GENE.GEMP01088839.1~~GEMP01088839.1.p1  ORF type:complete len:177 (+),score=21.56 GEMP01088839.1:66-596(+)